jgi:phenylalanyl-tRNA synthetase beta chain
VRKLGKQIPEEQISHILTALGFGAQRTAPGLLTVTVPSWRTTKDISLKDDLVEEVGRMIGYDSIEPQPPLIAAVVPPGNPMRLYLRQIRGAMAAQGFTETYNYSFINEQDAERFGPAIADHIAVRNPIASELTHLRRSLLPGIFRNIVSNVRHSSEFRIFEIGNEIHPAPVPPGDGTPVELPTETPHLCAAMYNQHGDERDFFELKRVLESLWSRVELRATAPARSFEHPTRVASVVWGQEMVGRFFELHPSSLHAEGVEGRAFVIDLDLRLLQQLTARSQVKYSPLRKYPTSGFDLSVLTALHLPVAQIEADLRALGGSDIVMVDFVRQYAGPPLSDGQKSVSYHLEAGAPDHTLTAEEATDIRQRLIDGMRSRGYELRV